VKKLVICLLFAGMMAYAQTSKTTGQVNQRQQNNLVHVLPAAVPTSLTTWGSGTNIDVLEIDLTNTTGSAITATVNCTPGTAVAILSGVSIGANTTYVIAFPWGHFCTSGVNWQASATGLNGYIVGRQ
jgi:hypothetical protein